MRKPESMGEKLWRSVSKLKAAYAAQRCARPSLRGSGAHLMGQQSTHTSVCPCVCRYRGVLLVACVPVGGQ